MEWLREFFLGLGLNQAWSVALSALLGVLGALLAGYLLYYCVQRLVFRLAQPALAWQEELKKRHAGRSAAWSLAVVLYYEFVLPLIDDWPWLQKAIGLLLEGLLVLFVTLTLSRVYSGPRI